MRIFILIIIGFLGQIDLNAQSTHVPQNNDLYFFADVMINADLAKHRTHAASTFEQLFLEALEEEDSFSNSFDSIIWISKIAPEDETFRIFSWQIMIDDATHKYYAVLQKSDGTLIKFNDNRPVLNGFERSQYTSEQWYGALYYGIFPFRYERKNAYVLLGFDGNDEKTNRKVADILLIDDNQVILGAPVFVSSLDGKEEVQNRIMIEYGDAAAGRIQFDRGKKMIVYDHMITLFSEGPGKGAIPVPDGSYEAYELKGNKWVYIDKVFNQVLDTPPREKPILEGRTGKDLFGRKKN